MPASLRPRADTLVRILLTPCPDKEIREVWNKPTSSSCAAASRDHDAAVAKSWFTIRPSSKHGRVSTASARNLFVVVRLRNARALLRRPRPPRCPRGDRAQLCAPRGRSPLAGELCPELYLLMHCRLYHQPVEYRLPSAYCVCAVNIGPLRLGRLERRSSHAIQARKPEACVGRTRTSSLVVVTSRRAPTSLTSSIRERRLLGPGRCPRAREGCCDRQCVSPSSTPVVD